VPVDQLSYGLPIREFLLVGLVSAVVTLLLTGPVRMLALKVGAVAWPRGRDVHVTPTPRWGGLAMFGGVLAGLLLALQLPALRLAYFEGSTEVMGVVVATALLVGVGMLDDRYDLDAITKFAAQVTAGGLLVLYTVQWSAIWIPLGGGGTGISGSYLLLGQSQSVLLTVLLTVGLVNALNFIDGLDGLAAGIGMITTLATAVFCVGLISENGNDPAAFTPALIAVVLAGACLGFLPHNFNPARIFMGDTGSMMVGVMLSAAITSASGRLTFNETVGPGDIFALVSPVFVLVGIVFIPVLDLMLAVIRRTRAGTSPFSPDKMHLHHRLLQVGHSHRRAVLLVYLWVAVIAFGAVALALVPQTGLVVAATGVALIVAFVASVVPHLSRQRAAAAGAAVAVPVASADDEPDPPAVDDLPAGSGGTTVPVRPGGAPGPGPVRPRPDGRPAPADARGPARRAPDPPAAGPAPGDGVPPRRPGRTPVPGSGAPRYRPGEPPGPGADGSPYRAGEAPVPGAVPPHRPGATPGPGSGVPPYRQGEPSGPGADGPRYRPGETPGPGAGGPPYRAGETPVPGNGVPPSSPGAVPGSGNGSPAQHPPAPSVPGPGPAGHREDTPGPGPGAPHDARAGRTDSGTEQPTVPTRGARRRPHDGRPAR
jgi:UDP-GlcNAc:undecaprenyl-phosphate GlcNAc-1-phosphate transferase